MLDYGLLRLIWWVLLGLLLAGFAVMDGFDLGLAALLPWVAKTDEERQVVLNTVEPMWAGNQVWLILGIGILFSVWPALYMISFSGFYLAMFLVLAAFIIRPFGFKYRSKINDPRWRKFWDGALSVSGFVAALIFGLALGNVLQGVPFYFDSGLHNFYKGGLLDLLNPFGLLCGIVSVVMLAMHGSVYLAIKTENPIRKRALGVAQGMALLFIVTFALGGVWIAKGIPGYEIVGFVSHEGYSNPLFKHVIMKVGAWLNNYNQYPAFILAPGFGFLGAIGVLWLVSRGCSILAFICSSVAVIGTVFTVGFSMYPFILPSSLKPSMSLIIWDSSSSQATLMIMLVAAAVFLPAAIFYTRFVYRVLRSKVTGEYTIEKK